VIAALVAVLRFRVGTLPVLAGSAMAGLVLSLGLAV